MNRADLINEVINHANSDDIISHAQVERIITSAFDIIKDTVAGGDEVAIAHFGTFKTVHKKATTAKNPRTGETVQVPAKTAPKFVPGKSFKDAVNK